MHSWIGSYSVFKCINNVYYKINKVLNKKLCFWWNFIFFRNQVCYCFVCTVQIPECDGEEHPRHNPQYTAQGQLRWHGGNTRGDHLQACRRHAWQTAKRLYSIWSESEAGEDGQSAANEHLPTAGNWPHATSHRDRPHDLERPQTCHRWHHHHVGEPTRCTW